MKRLVIHPRDRTTEFLTQIYEPLDCVTLVRGGCSQEQLKDMIREHDQVLMMGHGSPLGLMSVGQFWSKGGHIIDDSFRDVLAEKDNSVFIWCNADQYVKHNKLDGFYTGMFISETSEARFCGLPVYVNQNHVDDSNNLFAKTVGQFVEKDTKLLHAAVRNKYSTIAYKNPVAQYNRERLYHSDLTSLPESGIMSYGHQVGEDDGIQTDVLQDRLWGEDSFGWTPRKEVSPSPLYRGHWSDSQEAAALGREIHETGTYEDENDWWLDQDVQEHWEQVGYDESSQVIPDTSNEGCIGESNVISYDSCTTLE